MSNNGRDSPLLELQMHTDDFLTPLPSPLLLPALGTKRQSFGQKHRACIAVLKPIAAWIAYNVFYKLSLFPASSPAQMNGWLPYLGVVLVLAVLSLSSLTWLAFWQHPLIRRFLLVMIPLNVFGWLLVDSGNRLEEHGAFNMLIFLIIFVPVNLISLFFFVWWRLAGPTSRSGSNKKFVVQVVVWAMCSLIIINWLTIRDREWAKHGFGGVRIDDRVEGFKDEGHGLCQWKEGTAWLQLLPFRQNFFVGPLTCKKDNSFSAHFEGDKLVIEDCHAPTTPVLSYVDGSLLQTLGGPGYSLLPPTEDWGLLLKADNLNATVNLFQRHVFDNVYNHTYPYSGPVTIDQEVDTVLARCGTREPKLVYRIPDVKLEPAKELSPGSLNVVTIFVDSISRPMFHRKLPQTSKALELLANPHYSDSATDSTSSHSSSLFEFFRYHTVGINTGPNTRALWAGLPWNESTSPNSPPLWEQFRNAGYITGRVDSMCQDWDAYYNTGNISPNNTITVPRTIDHEFVAYSCLPPYHPPSKNLAGNFWGPTSIVPRCLSSEHQSTHGLAWADQFVTKYRSSSSSSSSSSSRPFYLNAGFMDSHEGSGEMVRAMDEQLSRFIHPDTSPIDYSNTALLVVSDHGALMGLNYVFFLNGKSERAQGFAALVLPDEYLARKGRGQRLADARMKLVNGHDFYETVRGFAGPGSEEEGPLGRNLERERRGVDLAEEELGNRNCEEALVDEGGCWCV